MSTSHLPTPLPAPYLCCDPGSFAENTLLNRLPEIARRVIAENQFSEITNQNILKLIADMPDGIHQGFVEPNAPDEKLWKSYLAPYTGHSWRQLSFLVCEHTFYRRILSACGYFQPGPSYQIDPYSYHKALGLAVSRSGIEALAVRLETWLRPDFSAAEALQAAIENNLWGNRADLSLWPADAAGTPSNTQLHQSRDFLLVNHLSEMVAAILNPGQAPHRIDFMIDNAGFELVCDLALADLLLQRGWAGQVYFHLKAHPTFVSDALSYDVKQTIEFLQRDEVTASFGMRLGEALGQNRLILADHYFWNSPLAGWEMPADLRNSLAQAALVISKGDANYRRLLGDYRWQPTDDFARITAYFPTRLAALRTSKSEVLVGLKPGQAQTLSLQEADWQVSGRWGLVQYKP